MPEEIDYRHEFAYLLGYLESACKLLASGQADLRQVGIDKIIEKTAELSARFPVGRSGHALQV